MRKTLESIFAPGPAFEVKRFSAGEAADLLGVPRWRLQKILSSPQYGLSSTVQLIGKGRRGSRRTFTENDLYVIALAARLSDDGFAAKFIGKVLESLRDQQLGGFDEHGDEVTFGIALCRNRNTIKADVFPSGKPPKVGVGAPYYYAVDMADVIGKLKQRIMDAQKSHNK